MGCDIHMDIFTRRGGEWHLEGRGGSWPTSSRNYHVYAVMTGGEVRPGRGSWPVMFPKPRGWEACPIPMDPEHVLTFGHSWLNLSDFDRFRDSGGWKQSGMEDRCREIGELEEMMRELMANPLVNSVVAVFSFDE